MYLTKEKQQNIEGAIAWLQTKLDMNPEDYVAINRDGAILFKEFLEEIINE